MKYKTVVDTNAINNDGLGNKFFGSRVLLEELIDYIDLYVPSIVILEIKEHKRRSIIKQKSFLTHSDLVKITEIDLSSLDDVDSAEIIDGDYEDEDYPHTVLKIDNAKEFLNKFMPLAIRGEPPFQGESNDKGIKDAMVASCVEELLSSFKNETIILVTTDSRLREYFCNNDMVRVVSSLADLKQSIEHDDGVLTEDVNGDKKIKFIGLREKTPRQKAAERMVIEFRNSPNFRRTHELVERLKKNSSLLELSDKVEIIKAALDNNQIRWIISDQDVYDFLIGIYFDCIDSLDAKTKSDFELAANDMTDSQADDYTTGVEDIFDPPF